MSNNGFALLLGSVGLARSSEDGGKGQVMRIYIGEADRWRDKPLYQGLVEAMRANDIAGVTVYRGILGYGAHRALHKDKPLHLSHDSSVMLSAVDSEEKLRFFPAHCRSDGGRRPGRLLGCRHCQVLVSRSGCWSA